MKSHVLGLCVFCLSAIASRAADPPKLPTSSPPIFVLASAVEANGKTELRIAISRSVVEGRVRVVEREGRRIEEQYRVVKPVFEESIVTVEGPVQVLDRNGKPIDGKSLPKLLPNKAVALLALAGKVDPIYLQAVRDDVLVISLGVEAAMPPAIPLLPRDIEPAK